MSTIAEEIPCAKNLSKNEITTFLQYYLSRFQGFSNIRSDDGINVALFISDDSEELLKKINSAISVALNNYIETTFNESCKKYNRNIIFYESEVKDRALFLRW